MALVDLRLPDGDGNALAPRLKELAPEGQVVLLTGFATLESAVSAVRAGACAYLVKPCAMEDLLLTVEQAMRQVRLHAEKLELARRARTAEKLAAVGTMTAGLSHEIRNPLNAAALQLNVLERRLARLDPVEQAALREPLLLVKDEIPAPGPHPGGLPAVREAARVRGAPGGAVGPDQPRPRLPGGRVRAPLGPARAQAGGPGARCEARRSGSAR